MRRLHFSRMSGHIVFYYTEFETTIVLVFLIRKSFQNHNQCCCLSQYPVHDGCKTFLFVKQDYSGSDRGRETERS